MIQVTMQEMEKNVSQLIRKAIAGEDVFIIEADQPVAKLTALNGKRKSRVPGSAQGRIAVADDLDASLADWVEHTAITETSVAKRRPPIFGCAKPYLIHMADDFDEPLEDFSEYM